MNQVELIQRLTESPGRIAWFLGAGASQSAGLPTAVDVIWYLKRRHYCSKENQRISANDLQNPAIKEKIDSYMRSLGFPATDDPVAYSRSFELIFADDRERQSTFLRKLFSEEGSSLTLGHRAFGALLTMGVIKAVFTTNFDTVVERAVAEVGGKALAAFHLEGSYAARAALNNDEFPLYCKLHGDFRYESIKNLEADLKTQDKELGDCLVTSASRFGLVVAGYSGRDASVMELLSRALDGVNPFPHGLFWTGLKGRPPLPAVTTLLEKAISKGVRAAYVEIETFDSLLSRIWNLIENRPPELVSKVGRTGAQGVSIPLATAGTAMPLLRLNALPITQLPASCLELTPAANVEWSDLQIAEKNSRDRLVAMKGSAIWAWGSDEVVRELLGSATGIKHVSLAAQVGDLDHTPYLKGFLERGLGLALRRGKPLVYRTWRGGSVLILDRLRSQNALTKSLSTCVGDLHGQVPDMMTVQSEEHPNSESVWWAEALKFNIETVNGQNWLLLWPDVWIWPRHARKQASNFIDQRTSARFNRQADALLSGWLDFLFPNSGKGVNQTVTTFESVESVGNPAFTINTRTAFSRRLVA
jgi:hypothetical protein